MSDASTQWQAVHEPSGIEEKQADPRKDAGEADRKRHHEHKAECGVTKELSVKLGLDAWTSPLGKKDQPVVVDYAGRAGISWMF